MIISSLKVIPKYLIVSFGPTQEILFCGIHNHIVGGKISFDDTNSAGLARIRVFTLRPNSLENPMKVCFNIAAEFRELAQ